jgi:hypothetical protein
MPIAVCPECQAKVSDRAPRCRSCGCPIPSSPASKPRRYRGSWFFFAGSVLLVVTLLLVAVLVIPSDGGLRAGDEVIVKGSNGVHATVMKTGGTAQGRPAVRIRLDNGPKAAVRFEEMWWPIDELELAQPNPSAPGR